MPVRESAEDCICRGGQELASFPGVRIPPMAMRNIVFDLDGTLIDSAASILASMQTAFDQAGIVPLRPLTPALIGPPLAPTLRALLPDTAAQELPGLIERFKCHYDDAGCRQARVYPGVQELLNALGPMPLRLYIATNKRIVPTRSILKHLGWDGRFAGIHALDGDTPALPHKTALLQRLRQTLTGPALYVGDRAEDADAAEASGMPFLWASWGYGGEGVRVPPSRALRSPLQLLTALQNIPPHQDDDR